MHYRRQIRRYLWLWPSLILLIVLIGYPLEETFRLSFLKIPLLHPGERAQFVGLDNFRSLVRAEFWVVLLRTLLWTASSVLAKLGLGFCGALLLNGEFRGRGLARTFILPPWIIPLSIGAFVWGWVYNGQYGLLNGFLLRLGILEQPFEVMANRTTAFLGCLANDIWVGAPFMTLIVLAGLQAVPEELYEAALVDGAGTWARFRWVTLPQIKTVVLIGLLLSTVWTFNSFDIIWVHTRGGPLGATTTMVIKTFKIAFEDYRFGLASAFATITFLVLLGLSFIYSRFIKLGEVS